MLESLLSKVARYDQGSILAPMFSLRVCSFLFHRGDLVSFRPISVNALNPWSPKSEFSRKTRYFYFAVLRARVQRNFQMTVKSNPTSFALVSLCVACFLIQKTCVNFFNRLDSKLKSIAPLSLAFSRASRSLLVFLSSSHLSVNPENPKEWPASISLLNHTLRSWEWRNWLTL